MAERLFGHEEPAAGPGRHARRLGSRRRGQAAGGGGLRRHRPARDAAPRPGQAAAPRGPGGAAAGLRGGAGQPPPQAGPGLRAHRLPVRRPGRLRRLPGPPAPPPAHHRVAAAHARPTATSVPTWSTPPVRRGAFDAAMARSAALFHALEPSFAEQAPYAVAMAYRVRFVMQCNAREAMHLLELRTAPQGHPSYRRVGPGDAPADRRAGRPPGGGRGDDPHHHADPELERLEAERRAEERPQAPVKIRLSAFSHRQVGVYGEGGDRAGSGRGGRAVPWYRMFAAADRRGGHQCSRRRRGGDAGRLVAVPGRTRTVRTPCGQGTASRPSAPGSASAPAALARANGLRLTSVVHPGRVLKVPVLLPGRAA